MILSVTPNIAEVSKKFDISNLTWFKYGYKYSNAYKSGKWDGKIKFYKIKKNSYLIPTGLLLKIYPQAYNLIPQINKTKKFNSPIKLRDYQQEAINIMFEKKRGIIQLPTGTGKTTIFLDFLRQIDIPTIIIVNRKDLLYQIYKRGIEYGFNKIGVVGAGEYNPTFNIDIATIQTLNKINDVSFFKPYKCIIIDECHLINYNAGTHKKVINKFFNAWHRFGFSATPFRYNCKYADDLTLISLIGDLIYTKKELNNILADVNIKVLPITYIRENGTPKIYLLDDYREKLNYVLGLDNRIDILKQIKQKHYNESILFIAPNLSYAIKISEILNIPLVSGKTAKNKRKQVYDNFRQQKIKHLVATTVYDEGVDFPHLNIVVFCQPFKSYLKVIQRIGRGRRKNINKQKVLIYDLMDDCFPKQNNARLSIYKKEGYNIQRTNIIEVKEE